MPRGTRGHGEPVHIASSQKVNRQSHTKQNLVARIQFNPTRRSPPCQCYSSCHHNPRHWLNFFRPCPPHPRGPRQKPRLRPAELPAPCVRTNHQRNSAHQGRTIPHPRLGIEPQFHIGKGGRRRWRGRRVGQYCRGTAQGCCGRGWETSCRGCCRHHAGRHSTHLLHWPIPDDIEAKS